MGLRAPATGTDVAFGATGGGVSGSPGTTADIEKHFERGGWTVVELPASEIATISNDRKNVAFCITDADEFDATIRASDPIAVFTRTNETVPLGSRFDGGGALFRFEDRAEGSELRGFGIDARTDGRGAKVVQTQRGCRVRDVTVRGEIDGRGQWPTGGCYATVPRGEEVVLEGLRLPGGASRGNAASHHDSIGVILNGPSNGVLRMKNCTLGGFGNNGLYASGPTKKNNDGYAIVEGGEFFNSDRDQLRVGGRGRIRGAHCYSDRIKPGFNNLRGIWCRYARGVTIEDVTIEQGTNDPGEAIRVDSTAGKVTVENADVRLDSSHKAARGLIAKTPDNEARDAGAKVTVRDSDFRGSGSPRDVLLFQSGRPRPTLDNVTIDVPGAQESIDIR